MALLGLFGASSALAHPGHSEVLANKRAPVDDFAVHHRSTGSALKYILYAANGFPGNTVNWHYNHTDAPAAAGDVNAMLDRLNAQMRVWEASCGIKFVYQGQTTSVKTENGQNTISWGTLASGVGGVGGVDMTGPSGGPWTIKNGFVQLNKSFAAGNSTILHELGHMIGIGHSDVEGQLMSGPNSSNPALSTAYTHLTTLGPDDIAACQKLYGAPPAAAAVSTSVSGLNFGDVTVGSNATQVVTLTNTGGSELLFSAVPSVTGAAYALIGSTCQPGTPLAAGSSCTSTVRFAPASAGSVTGTLSFMHNATPSSTSVALSGNGTAVPVAQPALQPAANAFGNVVVGQSTSQVLTLTNHGSAPLAIASIGFAAPSPAVFAITAAGTTCAAGGTLAPGASCTVEVSFSPDTVASALSANLVIGHGAGLPDSTAAFSGSGIASPAPLAAASTAAVNFGNVLAGTPVTRIVTLSNIGTASLQITQGPDVSGAGFSLLGSTCGGTLAPGGSCDVTIQFLNPDAGDLTGTLTWGHNAAGSPLQIPLSARAVLAQPATVAVPVNAAWGLLFITGMMVATGIRKRRIAARR